jgi:hypothetical protein
MYQTLTRGFGLMAAQTWMVPSQKYDVIHYIRQTMLKPYNPSQYFEVQDAWLAGLPAGDSRGPEPSTIQPWNAMDYGPSLTHSYEVPTARHNIAQKGLAVRLDAGSGGIARGRHWMLFDTDTLRMAAAWSAPEKPSGILLTGGGFSLTGSIRFTRPSAGCCWRATRMVRAGPVLRPAVSRTTVVWKVVMVGVTGHCRASGVVFVVSISMTSR